MLSVSATTPWPGNAASPWITIGTAAPASRFARGPSWASARRASRPSRPGDVLEVRGVGLQVDLDRLARGAVGALARRGGT